MSNVQHTQQCGYEGFASLSARTAHRAAGRPGRRPSPLHPGARAHAKQRLRRGIAAVVRSSGGKARLELGQELEH
eukprot:4630974-Prymnesium_polylepis.1